MDFIANSQIQVEQMLAFLRIGSIEELFSAIPSQMRCPSPLVDDGLSEYEGIGLIEELGSQNTYHLLDSYIGAGAYEHHIPALVSAITSRSEFLTAYTPYQPEASQGLLQSIFEFQSALCILTGLNVANASLYDGASASAEALLMALRLQKNRNRICLMENLHPHYLEVIRLYFSDSDVEITDRIDSRTAAVLAPYPDFLGNITPPSFTEAKEAGAHAIVCANPLAFALFPSANELGADIAVGDLQPFGLPLNYGGPYAGFIACKDSFKRQLPGRIVGKTVDTKGKDGYVLTMQAREQHIRREKATSNICTNQALAALASLITLLWYGKEGLTKLALTNYQRAHYLKEELRKIPGYRIVNKGETFNEFAVAIEAPMEHTLATFRKHCIEAGYVLDQNHLLIAVTETKSKEQLDRYLKVAKEAVA